MDRNRYHINDDYRDGYDEGVKEAKVSFKDELKSIRNLIASVLYVLDSKDKSQPDPCVVRCEHCKHKSKAWDELPCVDCSGYSEWECHPDFVIEKEETNELTGN